MENLTIKYAELTLEQKPKYEPKATMTEAEEIEQIRREIDAIRAKHIHTLAQDRSLDFGHAKRAKGAERAYAKSVYNRTAATRRGKARADEAKVRKHLANPLSKFQSTQAPQGLVPLEGVEMKMPVTRAPIRVPKRKAYTAKLLRREANPLRRI